MQTATKTAPSLRFPEYVGYWRDVRLHDFLIPTPRAVAKPNDQFLAIGVRSHCRGTFQREGLDPDDISMDTLYVVNKDDLIVNITFAWEGAIAIAKAEDDGGLVSHRFPTYVFNERITEPNFFQHVFIQDRFRYFLKIISPGGAGRNRVLDKKDFLKLVVRLPERPEQEKIAAFLSAVDEMIRQLARKKELLLKFKEGVMRQLFDQEIRFRADNGNEFREWQQKALGEFVKVQGGYAFKSECFMDQGIPVIRISNVAEGRIELEDCVLYNEFEKDKSFIVNEGELLIAMSGATTGKVGVYRSARKAYLNQRVGVFRLKRTELDYAFLIHLVLSSRFKQQLRRMLVAGAQPNVSPGDIESLVFRFPDINEQRKIARFLSAIDGKIELVGRKIRETKTFKKALLQQMFV